MKRAKLAAILTTVVVTGTLAGAILRGEPPAKTRAASSELSLPGVPSDREPERYTGSFLDTSVSAMLLRLGVIVFPEDKTFAFPDPALGLGSTLFVYRAQEVRLTDAGESRTVRTWAKTVTEFAAEQRLELAEKDETVPARSADIPLGTSAFSIEVTRVAEAEVAVDTVVPFTTKYKDDANLEKGTNITEVKGKNGTLRTVYLVRRENGKEVSRKKLSSERTLEPVVEEIRRGTKITVLDEGKGTFYSIAGRQCGTGRMTAAHKTLPKGIKVRVINKLNGKSVVVTIDDRGPYGEGRVIDLSCDAFSSIASLGTGIIPVRVEKP